MEVTFLAEIFEKEWRTSMKIKQHGALIDKAKS